MRRVELVAPPMSGHLHPILALARELSERCEVVVLSAPSAQPRIARAGLHGEPLLTADDEALLARVVDPGHRVGSHPGRLYMQFQRALRLQERIYHQLRARYAASRPDLVIADFTLATVGLACDQRDVRWWTSHPSPCAVECADGPPAYFGGLRPATGAVSRMLHAAGRSATRAFKRTVAWSARRRLSALGFQGLYRDDGSERIYSSERLLLLGVPEFEFPRTWPRAATFVGPALYTPPSDHPDPPFVDGGRHVLVTLGTHVQWAKEEMASQIRQLARTRPDVQFHVSMGTTAGAARIQEENVVRLPFVDYDRHLARYDVVVHHGGAGVLHHCLQAGRPAVVWPLDYDQFDHAARLENQQAAIWPRTTDELARGVRALLDDDGRLVGLPRLQEAVRQTVMARSLSDLIRP